jgi:tetratricopeptide (TPR) repeat protein
LGGGRQPEVSAFEHARHAVAARDFAAAREHLTRWLAQQAQDAEAHLLMARACRGSGDEAGWNSNLRDAEKLHAPADQITMERTLGDARWHGSWHKHQELLALLPSQPPNDAAILEVLVQDDLDNDLPYEGVSLAGRWVAAHPDDGLAYYYRAVAGMQLPGRQPDAAIADARHALDLNPPLLDAHLLLARAYAKGQHFKDALAEYRAYLEKRPGNTEAVLGSADCQLFLSDVDGARATLEAFVAKDRTNARALLLLARADWVDGRPEASLARLTEGERLAPSDLDILRARLTALRQLERADEVKRCQQRYNAARAQDHRLAELCRDVGEQPERADLRCRAGELALEMRRDQEGLHWLKTALWFDPKCAPACRALADYWDKYGRPERAADYRSRPP